MKAYLSVPWEKVEPLENEVNCGMTNPAVLTSHVATEHNYAKFRSSHCSSKRRLFPCSCFVSR